MSTTYETFHVEAAESEADSLTPGALQGALYGALKLTSDDVGHFSPLGRAKVEVEIALARAMTLSTPMPLPHLSPQGRRLFMLRRASDPSQGSRHQVRVKWRGDTRPSPSLVVRALIQATDASFNAGDLGVVFEGRESLSLELSEGLSQRLVYPLELRVDGIELVIDEKGVAST